MGLGPEFLGCSTSLPPPPLCQQATSIRCVKIWLHIYRQNLLLAQGGGEGKDVLKKCSLISMNFNVKLIVLPKILHL